MQWEHFPLNPSVADLTQEIARVLTDNELLITEWSPIHLATMLKTWFWKPDVPDVSALEAWQKTCQYLYLPRLRDEAVFRVTLAAGTGSRDFFGIAYGKENTKYRGFSFGHAVSPVLDNLALVIEPTAAAAYAEAQQVAAEAARPAATDFTHSPASGSDTSGIAESGTLPSRPAGGVATPVAKRQFYGSIDLDPIVAKKQFADLVDEVVLQFTARPGVTVTIAIEIQAESPTGFDEGLQRAVKENCNVLRFKTAEFEGGE
jgi:hypothetical protein